MRRNRWMGYMVLVIGLILACPLPGFAERDSGYDVTSSLWTKAVLQVSGAPVTLKWKAVGTDITPSGDQVISGYFYADPADFAYGSEFNPEVFVKIYTAKSGWCNIAFNHVTVDNVTVSSAHRYAGVAQKTGTAMLTNRLVEHQYDGVIIDEESNATVPGAPTIDTVTVGNGQVTVTFTAPALDGGSAITGYIVTSNPDGKTGTGTTSPITVSGLTNGTAYSFTVQAINAVGTGQASTTSHSVTPVVPTIGKIPDTGQKTSYSDSFGEDADYTINTPSYTKLDASGTALSDSASKWAMIKDNVTGLIWENKTNDGSINSASNKYTWYDAQRVFIAQLNEQRFGGYSDWRLPTIKELTTIVHADKYDPAINETYFQYARSYSYWSSTHLAPGTNSTHSWQVFFKNGSAYTMDKTYEFNVRAVHGEPSEAFKDSVAPGRLVDNGNGTVTDSETGLMWQQGEPGKMKWEEALTYCENLELASYDDWRLPNRNELQTLADYSENDPAIDTTAFPGLPEYFEYYWTSTTSYYSWADAWFVYFSDGVVKTDDVNSHSVKNNKGYFRAVRGGR